MSRLDTVEKPKVKYTRLLNTNHCVTLQRNLLIGNYICNFNSIYKNDYTSFLSKFLINFSVMISISIADGVIYGYTDMSIYLYIIIRHL